MHEVITVQKFSENEWLIDGILEGNQNAQNVVIMLHEGGYNRDENGLFPVIEGSAIKKENNKIIFQTKSHGNYEILTNSLIKNDEFATFRYDLRNHGKSLVNDKMDKRDTLYMRLAKDLRDVIKYLKNKYSFKKIYFIGTGIGALVIEYYLTKINDIPLNDIKQIHLICPNSPKIIYNLNPKYQFSYQKQEYLLHHNTQFTKIKGIFEGKKTIYEAEENYDIEIEFAKLQLKTIYYLSTTDKLIPLELYLKILNKAQEINHNIQYEIITKLNDYGNTDHGLYDKESSTYLLKQIYQIIIDNH